MRDNRCIHVLWVEDDPMITSAYPNEADMVAGIELHPFPCWENAETELEREYDRWDAIILDAKCKYRKDDADKADKFLNHVIPKIQMLAARKNRTIPWYVLSGQGENDIRDLIPDVNDWDEDWFEKVHRRFYSKNGKVTFGDIEMHERHVLFNRIKTQVTYYRHEMQIEHNLYPDVFAALDRIDLAGEVGYYLMLLLEPIHFHGTMRADYNHRYVDLRKALEEIFRHMVEKRILPPNIVSKGAKENVNLSWSSLFLGGDQPENPENFRDGSEQRFWEKYERLTERPIIPKQLADWLKSAIFQTGGAVHTTTSEEVIAMNLEKYLPHVSASPYMLRSLAFGLCDFILWYDKFLSSHHDGGLNAINLWCKRKV